MERVEAEVDNDDRWRVGVTTSIIAAHPAELNLSVEATAEDLVSAAISDPNGVFTVSAQDIAKKLTLHESSLALAVRGGRVVGFMAVRADIALPRTGLRLAYIEGVIVHRDLRGQDVPRRLLDAAVGNHEAPDVVALHTQTPAMARALARWGSPTFPRGMGSSDMRPTLEADLARAMEAIGRPCGAARTGHCPGMYGHRLFLGERIPGLGDGDAMFAFTCMNDRARARGIA